MLLEIERDGGEIESLYRSSMVIETLSSVTRDALQSDDDDAQQCYERKCSMTSFGRWSVVSREMLNGVIRKMLDSAIEKMLWYACTQGGVREGKREKVERWRHLRCREGSWSHHIHMQRK